MDIQLDPRTRIKLEAFARRRKRLIAVRGVCAILSTILLAMTVVAIVDLLVVLPDAARIALSVGAYVLSAVVFYRTSLRWFLHRPSLTNLARMFEADRIDLKEEVLSAVELGGDAGAANDSACLRQLIQQRVASLVRPYQPVKMLPIRTVRRWIVAALAVILLCIGLSTIPGLRFPKLMARAFVPIANIGRVSSLHIRIVEPGEADVSIPRGDPVGIVVELSDDTADDVIVESYMEGSDRRNVIQMEPAGRRQYGTTVVVTDASLRYRVLSGKASTRFYTIHSRLRPHVKGFHKIYHYPAYSGLQDEAVSETAGDLRALQGTTVDLRIEADQPIASAELWIDISQERQVMPLSVAGPQWLAGQLQLLQSGTYRVHLVAQNTGFDNRFTPNYELTALGDLVPDVRITEPNENTIMPSDALVRLTGQAGDDLGLAEVRHMVRVNQGLWQPTTLWTDCGKSLPVKMNWDLLPLDLKPGDVVSTRLEATDLKGNIGESMTIQITIGSPGYSAEPMDRLAAGVQLQTALQAFADSGRKLRENLKSLQEEVGNNPSGSDTHRLFLQSAGREADRLEGLGLRAWELILAAARQEQSLHRSQDMVLAGRLLSRLRHDVLGRTHMEMDNLQRLAEIPKKTVDQLMNTSGPLDWQSSQLVRAHQEFLAQVRAELAAGEMLRLQRNEARMLEQARADVDSGDESLGEGAWIRLGRQQQAASREQEQIEQMLDEWMKLSDSSRIRQVRNVAQKLSADRAAMDELLKMTDPDPNALIQRSEQRHKTLEEAFTSLWSIQQTSASQASKSRDELAKSAGVTADELATLRWKVDSGVSNEKALLTLQGQANVEPTKLEEQRAKTRAAATEAEQRWSSSVAQLKDAARIEDSRTQADYPFVSDAADTAAAVEGLHTTAIDPETTGRAGEAISKIEKAYRILETGHGVIERRNHLRDMTWRERWEISELDRLHDPLASWPDWEKSLKSSSSLVQKSGFDKPTKDKLKEIADSPTIQSVRSQAEKRRGNTASIESAAREMELLTQSMSEVVELMEPQMQQAREVIAEYAPSLAEQLRAASRRADEIEEDTQSLTDAAEELAATQVQAEAGTLLEDQVQLNDRLDSVRDALRRDANRQDLGEEQARERARDADDALAMLRQPPPKAEELLGEAAAATESEPQRQALGKALEQQGKLSDALELLARHYENLESGQPQPTRAMLRATEQDSIAAYGIENQYEQADRLAQLSQMPPAQLRPILESELTHSEMMRQELGRIVDATLQQAVHNLEQMVRQEKDIGDRLGRIAEQQSKNDQPIREHGERMSQFQERARELARQAEQLAHTDIPRIAEEARQVSDAAEPSFSDAREAAQDASKQMPTEFNASPGALAEQVDEFASTMEAARDDLNAAAQKTESSANNETRQQARAAAQQARQANRQADQSARQAKQLARDLRDVARRSSAQLQQTDQQQGQVNEMAGPVTEDFRRAAGHAGQLNLPEADALMETARAMTSISQNELPGALDALEQSPAAQPAQEPVEQARSALAEQLDTVQKMLPESPAGELAAPPAGTQEQMAQWMARALDQLEAAELAQASQPTSAQVSGQMQQAMQQPLMNQQASMAQGRAENTGAPQSESLTQHAMASLMSSSRTNADMPPPTGQPLPEQLRLRSGPWGQLRKLEAADMVESRGEAIAEEYREMVHAYFDAISRQSKDK